MPQALICAPRGETVLIKKHHETCRVHVPVSHVHVAHRAREVKKHAQWCDIEFKAQTEHELRKGTVLLCTARNLRSHYTPQEREIMR